MTHDRIFLLVQVIIYLSVWAGILIFVGRRTGTDPKGVIPDRKVETIIRTGTWLWLGVSVLYILDADSVRYLGYLGFLNRVSVKGVGIGVGIVGMLLEVMGVISLKESFRVNLPREKTVLVTTGVYRYVRNPLVLSIYLLMTSSLLIVPSLLALLMVGINVVGYALKVRAEETYLLETHGAEYQTYQARTGRFFPRLLRWSGDERNRAANSRV